MRREKLKKTPPKPSKLSTGNLLLEKIEIKVITPKTKVGTVNGLLIKLNVPLLRLPIKYAINNINVDIVKNKNFDATID